MGMSHKNENFLIFFKRMNADRMNNHRRIYDEEEAKLSWNKIHSIIFIQFIPNEYLEKMLAWNEGVPVHQFQLDSGSRYTHLLVIIVHHIHFPPLLSLILCTIFRGLRLGIFGSICATVAYKSR